MINLRSLDPISPTYVTTCLTLVSQMAHYGSVLPIKAYKKHGIKFAVK
ncbi:hypothetical protein SHAQ108633_03100 [Shewanella aquimarina]